MYQKRQKSMPKKTRQMKLINGKGGGGIFHCLEM